MRRNTTGNARRLLLKSLMLLTTGIGLAALAFAVTRSILDTGQLQITGALLTFLACPFIDFKLLLALEQDSAQTPPRQQGDPA
ncbi:hypothetical protein [Bifidobacterium sp.]|uniref:hypothetical protein n=1 Tax=Bifidobacterium sp. TaxID=41200 RepID=UPI0039EB11C9